MNLNGRFLFAFGSDGRPKLKTRRFGTFLSPSRILGRTRTRAWLCLPYGPSRKLLTLDRILPQLPTRNDEQHLGNRPKTLTNLLAQVPRQLRPAGRGVAVTTKTTFRLLLGVSLAPANPRKIGTRYSITIVNISIIGCAPSALRSTCRQWCPRSLKTWLR